MNIDSIFFSLFKTNFDKIIALIFFFPALQSLATLVLENTGVTDAGIIQYITDISMHQPPNLKCLNLNRTAVTQKIFGPLTGNVVLILISSHLLDLA